jgi:hypothetical protein
LDKEPTREVAEACIDLLDYLLEYLFVLPNRIDELKKRVDDLDVVRGETS